METCISGTMPKTVNALALRAELDFKTFDGTRKGKNKFKARNKYFRQIVSTHMKPI